jgi:hypothetical protein
MVLLPIISIAQFSDTKTFNQNDLVIDSLNGYDFVYFEDCAFLDEIGSPKLPVFIFKYIIPHDSKVDSVYITNKIIDTIPGNFIISPVQEPILTDGSSQISFVYPNPDVYESSDPYPTNNISVKNEGMLLGHNVVTISLCPIEYIPSAEIIKLLTSINFTIAYSSDTESKLIPLQISSNRYEIISNYLENSTENFNLSDGSEYFNANIIDNNNYKGGFNFNILPSLYGSMPDYCKSSS